MTNSIFSEMSSNNSDTSGVFLSTPLTNDKQKSKILAHSTYSKDFCPVLIFYVHQDLLRYGLSLKNQSEVFEKALLIFLFNEGISGTALDPSEGYTQDSALSDRIFCWKS